MKKIKNKNGLTATCTAVGACRRGPEAVPRGLVPEVLSCRRTPRRQGLNAGGRCIFLEIFGSSNYFSKIKEKI
jgi:hypothetical protein